MIFMSSISAVIIATLFISGWRRDSRFRIILTPFLLFSGYFILRVIPGFAYGVIDLGLNPIHISLLVIAYLAFFTGYFSSGISPSRFFSVTENSRKALRYSKCEKVIYLFIFLVVASGYFLYRGIPPAISAAFSLGSSGLDPNEVAALVSSSRREISKGHIFNSQHSGSGIIREILFCSSIFLVVLCSQYMLNRPKAKSILIFIVSLLVSYVFVSGDGTRGRYIVVLSGFFVSYSIFKKVKLSHAAAGFGILVLLLIIMSIYTNKMVSLFSDGRWGEIFFAIFERIFIGNSINDAVTIKSIEDGYLSYGYGYWLIRDFLAFIPGVEADKPLAYYLYLFHIGGDSTTYLTGTSISRSYADGGYFGVIIYFLILGFISRHLWKLALTIASLRSEIKSALVVSLWVAIGQSYVSGFAGVIFVSLMLIFLVILAKVVDLRVSV